MTARLPTICFVGPAVGGHPGHITTQGEVLAGLFRDAGQPVRVTSTQVNKLVRPADSLSCLVRWRRSIDVAVISVFSGRAFSVVDAQSRLTTALHLPTVLWLHGGDLPSLFAARPDAARRVLHRGSRVVAPTDYLRRAAEPFDVDVTVIPNVLDLDGYQHRARPSVGPRLLWMRTFHPLYRPTMALDVLERVRRTRPDATLTMAGHDAGELASTRAAAARRGLAGAVDFPGFLDPDQKATAFAGHDIFLNTNTVDNAPVSILEAAASGLPVVATAVGGVPALLADGRSALLVSDGDADAMAAAVLRLIDDPGLATSLAAEARRVAERSSWPVVRAAWLELVDGVLADRA